MVAVLHPIGQGQQIAIDRAVVLVGRSPECDIVIEVSSKISRLHCALVQVDNTYFIRDLGSMNGVYVNGLRVEKEQQLQQGMEVAIGDVKYQFFENVQPPVRQARPVQKAGGPVLIDDRQPRPASAVQPSTILHKPAAQNLNQSYEQLPDVEDVVEVVDAQSVVFVDDVEPLILPDDAVEVVDIYDDEPLGDIVEVVDVIDDDEVIENVAILEDVDVIEDVEVIPDAPMRPRRPPRMR